MSSPQVHHILNSIDARFSANPAALEGLLQTAGDATARRDLPRALEALTEYVNRNPEHASALLTMPSLGAIQGDVKDLLHHITFEARTDAVRLIGTAAMVVETAGRHPEGLDGATVLAIAERFVESGQLPNYLRAAELSQAVMAFYGGAVPEVSLGAARRGIRVARPARLSLLELAAAMWRRVPLLVLMMGWGALGLVGGAIGLGARMVGVVLDPASVQTGFEIWGVGFLVLVVLQFFLRGSGPG